MRYEIYTFSCFIGRPRSDRVLARADDVRDANVVREALQKRYVGIVAVRDTLTPKPESPHLKALRLRRS